MEAKLKQTIQIFESSKFTCCQCGEAQQHFHNHFFPYEMPKVHGITDGKNLYCIECIVKKCARALSFTTPEVAERIEHMVSDYRYQPERKPKTELQRKRDLFSKKYSGKKRREFMEKYEFRCCKCSSFKELHIDHIIPLSKGGSNDEDNLQLLCSECNLAKGNKIESYV